MPMKNLKLITIAGILFLFSSCQPGIQKGQSLSRNHVNYIRSLRLLSGNEYIILFDSQYKIRISGNFFTDKRIAAYWIDERDTAKRKINYAFYKDIDSIKTNYFQSQKDIPFLEVYKTDGKKFKVYVKADSIETKYFFENAIATWKKNHLIVRY
jgi:hypothetical protein